MTDAPQAMTFGSLFAGIGGMDLGLERAGFECRYQVEIDPYCRKVLAKHWPNVERFNDVREVGVHNLPPVDLICGGFPCQPVSTAGKRKGTEDERWLWPEFARLIRELRPRWVLGENVPGLLSIDAGRIFGTVLRDLAENGYDAEWDCIPAAAVGALHLRYRVFVVAHARQIRCDTGRTEQPLQGLGASGETCLADASIFQPSESGGTRPGGPRSRDGSIHCRNGYGADYWSTEPDVGRVADGVPARVDRLRGLGNAVVPAVAEFVGRRIVEADND